MKFKKILAVISMIALVLCCTSCGKDSSVPDGMKKISDDTVAYDFFVYEKWLVDDGVTNCAYYSASDRSNVSVTSYTPDAEFITVEDYYNSWIETHRRDLNNFTIVEEGRVMMHIFDAYQLVYTFTVGETSYKTYQALTLHGSIIYVFTYMSSPELYDSHIEEALGMLAELKFAA